MKIACEKYKITILKFKPVAKHITYFCGVIQSKYSNKKTVQVSKTGQQYRTQVSDCSRSGRTWKNVSYILKGQFCLANYKSNVNQRTNKRSVNETTVNDLFFSFLKLISFLSEIGSYSRACKP